MVSAAAYYAKKYSTPQVTEEAAGAFAQLRANMAGAPIFRDQPGVLSAVTQAQADPPHAHAIGQFLDGLQAETNVAIARHSGTLIHLSDSQRYGLDSMGVNYSDVEWTPHNQAQLVGVQNALNGGLNTPPPGKQASGVSQQQAQSALAPPPAAPVATKGEPDLGLDANGQPIRDAAGKIPVASDGKPYWQPGVYDNKGNVVSWSHHVDERHASGGGIAGAIFKPLGVATGALATGVSATVGAANEVMVRGLNTVQTAIAGGPDDETLAQDMKAHGYDPSSWASKLAFMSSGKAHSDFSNLNQKYGKSAVNTALEYSDNPEQWKKNFLSDPNNYADIGYGQKQLTKDAKAQLDYLSSKQFETLQRQLGAHDATVGNRLASAVGIDPVKNPEAFAATAAITNVAASFVLDPTLIAASAVTKMRSAAIGIESLGDGTSAARILMMEPKNPAGYVAKVQRGWRSGIKYGEDMRAAHAEGDLAKMASLTAKFNAEVPTLAHLGPEFVGSHAFTGYNEVRGKATEVFENTGGIQSMEDAARFVKDQFGLSRLIQGKSVQQATIMPGAVNSLGFRKLRGIMAEQFTKHSMNVELKQQQRFISKAEADPALAKKMIDQGFLAKIRPSEVDAVDPDGTIIAGAGEGATEAPVALPSQVRGEKYQITPAGQGFVQSNVLKTGDVMGESNRAVHFLDPRAIAARNNRAAQRLSTMLPRATQISYSEARGGELARQVAAMYMPRGHSNLVNAAWNAGDVAARKAIMDGVMEQLVHASGLPRTELGQQLADRILGSQESYSHAGNEVLIDGQPTALFEGQTVEGRTLPSFRSLQELADRASLTQQTLGRVFDSKVVDNMLAQWKVGALMKPSSFTRNWLEAHLRQALDGGYGSAVRSRIMLTTPNKELWEAGHASETLDAYKNAEYASTDKTLTGAERAAAKKEMASLEEHPIVQHYRAKAAGDDELANAIANAAPLSGQQLGRGRTMAKLTRQEKFEHLPAVSGKGLSAPLALMGRAYRATFGHHMDEGDVEAFLTLAHHDRLGMLENYHSGLVGQELGFRGAAKLATEDVEKGYGSGTFFQAMSRAVQRGKKTVEAERSGGPTAWNNHALNDLAGADRWSAAMGRTWAKDEGSFYAILRHLKDPDNFTLRDHVIPEMDKGAKRTGYGTHFFPNPDLPHAIRATTPEEVEAGKLDWASRRVEDIRYLLTKQAKINDDGFVEGGELHQGLLDHMLETGEVPSGEWLAANVPNAERPATALAPTTRPLVQGGAYNLWRALQDVEGGAYQHMVERMLQRNVTQPIFTAHYIKAYRGYEKMADELVETGGLSREAADGLRKELAMKQAAYKTEQIVDDPGQKTQFDVMFRNIFPFSRATQAMIRRWGTGLWQNPANARRMMLAYEGAHHMGLVYTDDYGEPAFTYPTSTVMKGVLTGLRHVPGFENIGQFPLAADMTGNVLMSVPGADNPFRMGMGPMASIPLRLMYEHLLPNSVKGDARSLDEFINGPVGQGETMVQLVPTAVRHFYQAMDTNERNSALASATTGAIANLAAAGLAPNPDAPPSVKQQFMGRLRDQVASQLYLRAALGLIAPAAPSKPTEDVKGAEADYAWDPEAIRGLSDEYKKILNETGGDVGRANAVFTYLHPDSVVYKMDDHGEPVGIESAKLPSAEMVAKTKASVKGAYLPATKAAMQWIDENHQFIGKYKSVAALFVPAETADGEFDYATYAAQLEQGLRQRKTPSEFLNDIYVKNAQGAYYSIKDAYDEKINEAHTADNTALATQLENQKKVWSQHYLDLNPALKTAQSDYAGGKALASNRLSDLREMLKNNEVPNGLTDQVHGMVLAYDHYVRYTDSVVGNTAEAKQEKDFALSQFNGWVQSHVTADGLPIYNAVFRPMSNKFVEFRSA